MRRIMKILGIVTIVALHRLVSITRLAQGHGESFRMLKARRGLVVLGIWQYCTSMLLAPKVTAVL